MLAEPKRKTVWSLNPRGKYWSEDKTKFGQKLLESMGWREGLGLGKDQNGIKEHIRVTVNSDNKGLGYKASADDVWIDKNTDFDELLTNLALHHNNPSISGQKVSNLEEISKRMKNRVHYNKLIKAKNLSQCSERDLISIFPTKRDKSDNNVKKDSESNCQQNNGNTFESNTNINDYFKSKMDKMKLKSQLFCNSHEVEDKESQICEQMNEPNDGLGEDIAINSMSGKNPKSQETNENSDNNCVLDSMDVKKKCKKNKRKIEENIEIISNECQINEEMIKKPKKSKKHKKWKKNELKDTNESQSETQSEMSCDTSAEPNEVMNESIGSTTESVKKWHKKAEKNIKEYKIKLPKGYEKTLSVNELLKNYHKIVESVSTDRVLNTTNLLALKGYGCDSD